MRHNETVRVRLRPARVKPSCGRLLPGIWSVVLVQTNGWQRWSQPSMKARMRRVLTRRRRVSAGRSLRGGDRVLPVVDLADEAVAENADAHRGIRRHGDGVLATVTLFGRSRGRVLGMMTAAVGQGRAGQGRAPGRAAGQRISGASKPAPGEEADQCPRRVGQPETLAVAQRCPGQQVQRVTEQGRVLKGPDQQLPVDLYRAVHRPK